MPQAIANIESSGLRRAIGKDLSAVSVIVLDDNEFDQRQLGRVLKSAGISGEVSYASDLTDFTRLLTERLFDFAFIDFNLADGTGLDAMQILREQPADRSVLPIMVAGEARMELAVQAMKDGCKDFLPKQELSAERLRDAIFGALRQTSRGLDDEQQLELQGKAIISTVNDTAIAGLRPRLARMLRIVRQAVHTSDEEDRNSLLQLLDDNCIELSDYCDEIAEEASGANTKTH